MNRSPVAKQRVPLHKFLFSEETIMARYFSRYLRMTPALWRQQFEFERLMRENRLWEESQKTARHHMVPGKKFPVAMPRAAE